jgi:hypothetical protein
MTGTGAGLGTGAVVQHTSPMQYVAFSLSLTLRARPSTSAGVGPSYSSMSRCCQPANAMRDSNVYSVKP